jgi:hypothetical protein
MGVSINLNFGFANSVEKLGKEKIAARRVFKNRKNQYLALNK